MTPKWKAYRNTMGKSALQQGFSVETRDGHPSHAPSGDFSLPCAFPASTPMGTAFISVSTQQHGSGGFCVQSFEASAGTWVLARARRCRWSKLERKRVG